MWALMTAESLGACDDIGLEVGELDDGPLEFDASDR
jgi:hypothetical protein